MKRPSPQDSHEPSALSRYFSDIRGIPLLSPEEEERVVRGLESGQPDAVNKLVESNLSFVAKVAMEYRYLGVPVEDLLNEGNLGLIEAARRFDSGRGVRFITYAIWWIRKSILKAVSDKARLVRLPDFQNKRIRRLREERSRLRQLLGRDPSREEIAEQVSLRPTDIDRILQHGHVETSLDRTVGDEEEVPLSELLRQIGEPDSEQQLIHDEMLDDVVEAFGDLSDQQKVVLALRYGLGDAPALTLREVGRRLRVSRERVRQIECQATHRLKQLVGRRRRSLAPSKETLRPLRAERERREASHGA